MAETETYTPTQRLRDLADWLDAHPTALPSVDLSGCVAGGRILDYAWTRNDLVERATAIGGQWEKDVSDTYFWLRQEIVPGITYGLYTLRETVCERVVVGTKEVEVPDPDVQVPTVKQTREIVEWRCPDSLLDAGPATYSDGSTDSVCESLDVLADVLAGPGEKR